MIGGGRKNSKYPNTVKYVDRDDYALATKMMSKFCDLSLKTIYITHKHKKIEMQVLLSQEKKKHNNFPKKIAHILYNIIRNTVAIVVIRHPQSKINFALKLYLHLSTSFIRLASVSGCTL